MNESRPKPDPPNHYPVFLDLRGRQCLVVGGGTVARRKVEALVEAGAEVTVVAPRVEQMPESVRVVRRPFQPNDLDGAVFVIAAADDAEVNALVSREAQSQRIWVNVVDDTALCSAILPAVLRRGSLRIAISTAGASPVLARRLRERLEHDYGPEYGDLVDLLRSLRQSWEPRAAAAGLPMEKRKKAWEDVLDLPLLGWLHDGDRTSAMAAAQNVLEVALAEG